MPVPPPRLGAAFLGKLRDKMWQGIVFLMMRGAPRSTLFPSATLFRSARTVTRLELRRAGGGGVWDTDPATANWALGAGGSLDGALLNTGTGTGSFGVRSEGRRVGKECRSRGSPSP